MKNILLTGGSGILLENILDRFGGTYKFLRYTRSTTDEELKSFINEAEAVIHLAGVSRTQDPQDFYKGNSELTKKLTDALIESKKTIPLVFTSSISADMDNDFGKSKRLAEESVLAYGKTGAKVYILRLTNTFGKWAKINAHSVVATFCYNIAHDLPIQISDPAKVMNLAYVNDVLDSLVALIEEQPTPYIREIKPHYYEMTKTYQKTLAEIAEAIQNCKKGETSQDEFSLRIQETYSSYLA